MTMIEHIELMVVGTQMPVRFNLTMLLAEINLDRAHRGERPLSLLGLATESGIPHSVVWNIDRNVSTRIDTKTVDRLLIYLNQYRPYRIGDLLIWEPPPPEDPPYSDATSTRDKA